MFGHVTALQCLFPCLFCRPGGISLCWVSLSTSVYRFLWWLVFMTTVRIYLRLIKPFLYLIARLLLLSYLSSTSFSFLGALLSLWFRRLSILAHVTIWSSGLHSHSVHITFHSLYQHRRPLSSLSPWCCEFVQPLNLPLPKLLGFFHFSLPDHFSAVNARAVWPVWSSLLHYNFHAAISYSVHSCPLFFSFLSLFSITHISICLLLSVCVMV